MSAVNTKGAVIIGVSTVCEISEPKFDPLSLIMRGNRRNRLASMKKDHDQPVGLISCCKKS